MIQKMDWNKFKALTWKQKLQWFIQYYGIVTVVVLISIYVIFVFVKSILAPAPISDICILVYSDEVQTDEVIKIQEALCEKTGHTIEITNFMVSDVYGIQAFATKLTADQLDLIVAPLEQTEDMMNSNYLIGYEKIGSTELYLGLPKKARTGELLEQVRDYLSDEIENYVY